MIKITIDHNSDVLVINTDSAKSTMHIKGSVQEIQNILMEILNCIEPADVMLESINEDKRKTIGEW